MFTWGPSRCKLMMTLASDGWAAPVNANYVHLLSQAAAGPAEILWHDTPTAWSAATAYNIGDTVSLAGSFYTCILGHTNHTPPNGTYWSVGAEVWAVVLIVNFTPGGADHKVLVSSDDTTADYLEAKLAAGANITITETSEGGNETITIAAASASSDHKVNVSSDDTTPDYLEAKIVAAASTGISIAETSEAGNEALTITGPTADETSLHLSGTVFSLKALTGDATTTAGLVAVTVVSATLSDGATNTAPQAFAIRHNTSGTPAAGFGSTTNWALDSTTTANRTAADQVVTWVTATDASRAARVVRHVFDTAARETIREEAISSAPCISFLGATPALPTQSGNIGTALIGFGLMTGSTFIDGATQIQNQVPIANGGTGKATAVAGLDALMPKSTNIASAATTDLSTATGQFVDITGSTTITSFGTVSAGARRTLRFTNASPPLLTHNATSLILPGAVNLQTAQGDVAEFSSLGSGNWVMIDYQRAAASLTLAAGTYTPTISLLFNLASSTAYVCQYMRVGSVVTVSGKIDITAIHAPLGNAEFEITLPIASSFAADSQCAGTAAMLGSAANTVFRILADSSNGKADFLGASTLTADETATLAFTLTYLIV
jgi:hypothetical protein